MRGHFFQKQNKKTCNNIIIKVFSIFINFIYSVLLCYCAIKYSFQLCNIFIIYLLLSRRNREEEEEKNEETKKK